MAEGTRTVRTLTDMVTRSYRTNHLMRNSGWVIVATGINGVLGLIFWAEAAHLFAASTVGSVSALIAAMTFASTVALMGLGTTAVQVLPKADDELWSTAVNAVLIGGVVFGLLAGVITAVVVPHISPNLSFAAHPTMVLAVVVGTMVLTVATLLDYVFTAERATHFVTIRGASFGVIKVVFLTLLLVAGVRSGVWIVGAWVISSALTTGGTLLWQVRRLGRPHRYRAKGVVTYVRRWFGILMLHHMTALGSVMIPTLMPVLVVTRLSSVASAHFYVAWLLSSILLTVSSAVAGNLLAELSYGDESMATKIRRAARLIAALLLPPALVLVLLGREILRVFGSGYAAHSYGLLLLFVVVAIPDAVINVYVTVLRVRGEPHKAAAMNIGIAVIALGGAWALMGVLGVAGAAWAWALAQGVGCIYVAVDTRMIRHRTVMTSPADGGL